MEKNRPPALCGAVVLQEPTIPPRLTYCLRDANHNGDHKDADGNTRPKDAWEPPDSEAETPQQTGVVTETVEEVRFPAEEGMALCRLCNSILVSGEAEDGDLCMGCAEGEESDGDDLTTVGEWRREEARQ